MTISYEKNTFGDVTIDGKIYSLTEQAELTNRVFPGWWGDAESGETYTSEWSARAIGPDGEPYEMIWQFEQVKGSEQEPDTLDWDDVYSVRAAN